MISPQHRNRARSLVESKLSATQNKMTRYSRYSDGEMIAAASWASIVPFNRSLGHCIVVEDLFWRASLSILRASSLVRA
jgi:hypothetical protein